MTHFIEHYGLVFRFAIVCLERAGIVVAVALVLGSDALDVPRHRLAVPEA